MEDKRIIELFNLRDEAAISAVSEKYGAYCLAVARNILTNQWDSEECVNDTYLKVWNAIPPACPDSMRHFLAKITRNLAIDRYRASISTKRGGYETDAVFEELGEVLANEGDESDSDESEALRGAINLFLRALPSRERNLFIRRYFYVESVSAIAARYCLKPNHVSQILSRTRQKLKKYLVSEGFKI